MDGETLAEKLARAKAAQNGRTAATPQPPTKLQEFTLDEPEPPAEPAKILPPEPLTPSVFEWKMMLYELSKRACNELIAKDASYREIIAAMPIESFVETVSKTRNNPGIRLTFDPAISATELEEEVWSVAAAVQKLYVPIAVNGNGHHPPARRLSIIVEDQEQAQIANAEYLARPEIVERLGYSQSIALMIGAKHHGKTTNVRTLALSVMRGLEIWGRCTAQGAVVYVASDDEVASTRNELLQMGWNQKSDPLHFVHLDPESDATPAQVLEDVAECAIKNSAILIILDMLFDFVPIKNELSYAETRQAIGLIQKLADNTKALVVGSHHTPKYLTDVHTAANAALGSQGVSARFSPIILTRKWSDSLFTVESTTTRDPRGQALTPIKIIRNEQGWVEPAGEFKEWMKWEMYAGRVMGLFEGGDPTVGLTVHGVAEKLEIDRARAQNTLYQLTKLNQLKREKHGRSYRYYLASTSMFDREDGNFTAETTPNKDETAVHGGRTPKEKQPGDGDELDIYGMPKGW
jgi:hypothetical protein